MKHILMVEDDQSLIEGLSFFLKKNQYQIEIAQTLKEAQQLLYMQKFDLILLDVGLPDGNGFEFCKKIRSDSMIPVIFLTAADEEYNIVRGLDIGADDYITKPFKLNELHSRINALLRRTMHINQVKDELISNEITIKLTQNRAYRGGEELLLTAGEFRLLCLLVQNSNITLTREVILDHLWDQMGNYIDDNTLSVYIRRLRSKIEEDPNNPQFLLTVRGLGYRWKENNKGQSGGCNEDIE